MLTAQKTVARPPSEEFKRQRNQADRREEERIVSNAPLIVAPFGTRAFREVLSMTFNHSKDGMCLETAEFHKTGSVLYIRLDSTPAHQAYHGSLKHLRTCTLAEVKWCREFRDKFSRFFHTGVKYY